MSAPWLLAVDTATTRIVVAVGTPDGALLAADAFEGRYRHSQELMPAVVRLLDANSLAVRDLAGIIVGTGPGAFTGLRVGIATAKTLAHELGTPIVGIGTDAALLAAAGVDTMTLWLPSGPRDYVRVRRSAEPEVVHGAGPEVMGSNDAAVDLDGRAPSHALERGAAAVEQLPASLVRLGAARLAAGDVDDPERLVPRYASAPRGMPEGQPEGGVAWSRDPR
ncbi:MAG TPA: tRNA (adenosine(37)-N6)-threonylcarbamoyltransferase complex dimerization subunit type 1 TsaB [Candidatus Limnocylindrales bacterium]|nr:tRNA (adenosine(37)-N6)-threonylcarbamoyltransferase complex dimerization subunit type 1 TsaB [Candidatus Limnocylindrales bacterium]